MKLSSVANLISGTLSPTDFSAEISSEISAHTFELRKRGGIAHVRVFEDTDVLLNRAGLSILCHLFATGQLTANELAYVADALQLSERVEFGDEDIASDLAECTDPEINGPLTIARALEIAGMENGA